MDYEKRITNLQKMMTDVLDVEGIVITDGFNMNYLVGFTGGAGDGVVLVGKDKAQLITDGRYTEAYQNHLPSGVSYIETKNYYKTAVEIINEWHLSKVGFEENIPFMYFDQLDEMLDYDFVPTPSVVETLREIKGDDEIQILKEATSRSVDAFNELIKNIKTGMTEKQISNLLDRIAREHGLDKASFDTIVASGDNGAKPHAGATDKPIADGELVTIDFGYYYQGYTSDITRTFGVGNLDDKLKNIYEIVQKAQSMQVETVGPDVAFKEIDKIGRDYIDQQGFAKEFNHGTGHGIGLNIHEGPLVRGTVDDTTTTGNVITIEPGIYVSGLGGVRIEDDILVEKNGSLNLTEGISKELLIL